MEPIDPGKTLDPRHLQTLYTMKADKFESGKSIA